MTSLVCLWSRWQWSRRRDEGRPLRGMSAAHMARCPACRAAAHVMEELDAALSRGASALCVSHGLAERILRGCRTAVGSGAATGPSRRPQTVRAWWVTAAAGAVAMVLWAIWPGPRMPSPETRPEAPPDALGTMAWAGAAVDIAVRVSDWIEAPPEVVSLEIARLTVRMVAEPYSLADLFPPRRSADL